VLLLRGDSSAVLIAISNVTQKLSFVFTAKEGVTGIPKHNICPMNFSPEKFPRNLFLVVLLFRE